MTTELIKGVDPADKKTTLYDKLSYFCSQYHWNRAKLYSEIIEDGLCKPTVCLVLYNVLARFIHLAIFYRIRNLFQKWFRSSHLSDDDIGETFYHLSAITYKRVKAFRDNRNRGYPGIFTEYNDTEWKSIESYNEAIKDGRIIGGGEKEWDRILSLILMSLEHDIIDGWHDKEIKWYQTNFGMNPYEEYECNLTEKFEYKKKTDGKNIGSRMTWGKLDVDPEDCEFIKKEIYYMNHELMNYAEECVQYGHELLGQYWRYLWM